MHRLLFLAVAIAFIVATVSSHAEEAKNNPPATLQELDQALAKIFKDGEIPGAAVALVENGQVVFTKGYGVSDVAKKTAVTPDTVFRAGSISKSLTGIAIMTAVEEGKLSLDGRLADLAPDVKFVNPWEASDPVRLVHLIEHTTGWPDISLHVLTTDGPGWTLARGVQETSPEFVSRWQPGRFSIYNNAGPAVAGLILEKATGQGFNAYMRERVLRPMGVATGDFDLTPEIAARLSKSYETDGTETAFQNIILGPAGSFDVSAKELAQLVRFYLGRGAVDGRQILKQESVERVERGESALAARVGLAGASYGLGNAPLVDKGVTFRGHNGGIDSFTSVYGYSLQNNSGYVLMANGGEGVDFARPVSRLVQAYLTRQSPPKIPATVAIDQKELEGYAGLYRTVTPSNALTRPFQEVLGLTMVWAGQGKLTISGNDFFPTGAHVFRRADRDTASLAFAEDGGETFKMSAFTSAVKEPLWRAGVIAGVLGLMALGAVIAIMMSPVWLVAWLRGRSSERSGASVRFLPFLAFVAMAVTFALPIAFVASGSIPATRLLAAPGPYSITVLVCSVLFPLLAALGLWHALRADGANVVVRLYAGLTSLALLVFSAYAASIGWVGAQTWTM